MYPDQSLYPVDSVPAVVKRINNSLRRADQLNIAEGNKPVDYMLPIVADAEAGFGGVLNAHELMKAMIEAGAAGVHFEDQLASAKKCGHMGGKVLVPTQEAVQKLAAARLAADIYNTGMYLAGGGSMLRGLDKRLSKKTDLPVYIAEDPLRAVVRGTGIVLKNIPKYKSVLIK